MATAFAECPVSNEGQTLSTQVHKYGYNFKLCLEGNEYLIIRKETKRKVLGEMTFTLVQGKTELMG